MKKFFLTILLAVTFLTSAYYFFLTPKYTVPILIYHAVNYGKESFFVTPENFRRQMEYVKKKGYNVLTLDDLVKNIQSKKRFKRNEVVITFDDGYQDNFEYAYPVLRKFGFAATIFLVTDFMGNEKRFLNWDEVRAMSKNDISFGGHTKAHVYLGIIEDDGIAREQIFGSKKAIEKEINMPVDYFCYPGGGFNDRVKEIVKESGYKGACTTNRGVDRFNKDVYELKRIKVTNLDMNRPFSFWMKLSGYYNLFRGKKDSY